MSGFDHNVKAYMGGATIGSGGYKYPPLPMVAPPMTALTLMLLAVIIEHLALAFWLKH